MLPTGTFIEMRRLAHDETPSPLAMQPKVTALAWYPDGGNVILLGTHEPNRMAHDETHCLIIISHYHVLVCGNGNASLTIPP